MISCLLFLSFDQIPFVTNCMDFAGCVDKVRYKKIFMNSDCGNLLMYMLQIKFDFRLILI